MSLVPKLLEPVVHAREGVGARGIEEHQRKVDIVQEERVNGPEIGLPGEVPQHGLALRTILTCLTQFVHHPELLPMRGFGDSKAILRNAVAQAGFAHGTVANQRNLCAGVVNGRSSRSSTQEPGKVQVPDANHRIFFTEGCQDGSAGMKSQTRRPGF